MYVQKFQQHVDADYPRLVEIGSELVGKCQGLPLAAKALGGLLFSTRDEIEWENVLKSKTWELDGEGGEILPALRLSYRHLPVHLKRCFRFCSVYPKDHKFDQQQLVKMWIAHGFVRGKDGEQIEDAGSRYFNDLVQRSFFQYSISDQRYMMHDLVHDLAQSIAGSECFFNAIDFRQRQDNPKKARHLSIHLSLNSFLFSSVDVESIYELRGLRTLFFRGNLQWTNKMFNSLKFLRVLDLYECDVPDSIDRLRHLRYLKIKRYSIKELPESICNIYNLQTLILNGCNGLVKLPNGTRKLSNLRHLQLDDCYRLESTPPGIGRLTCLQTLSVFIVGREEERGIEELKNLTDLRGSLQVRNLEHVQNAEAARQANLRSKSYINELTLMWSNRKAGSSIDERLEEEVAEGLQPHPNVKKLYFRGYMGTHFPSWMMKSGMDMLLPNLTHVHLYKCRRCSILPPFGQLPSLVELSINAMDELKDGFGADEDEFGNLRKLHVARCPKLTKWPTKLSALSELGVGECLGFNSFPLIPSLKSLTIGEINENLLYSVSSLTSLSSLYLWSLRVTALPGGMLKGLAQLKRLHVAFSNQLETFPTMDDVLPNLTNITFCDCANLKSLTKGLHALNSLRRLEISRCPQVQALPEDGLPTGLQTLFIGGCPTLEERCREDTGEDWRKISHIPDRLVVKRD